VRVVEEPYLLRAQGERYAGVRRTGQTLRARHRPARSKHLLSLRSGSRSAEGRRWRTVRPTCSAPSASASQRKTGLPGRVVGSGNVRGAVGPGGQGVHRRRARRLDGRGRRRRHRRADGLAERAGRPAARVHADRALADRAAVRRRLWYDELRLRDRPRGAPTAARRARRQQQAAQRLVRQHRAGRMAVRSAARDVRRAQRRDVRPDGRAVRALRSLPGPPWRPGASRTRATWPKDVAGRAGAEQ
jgi:hypothetical protein